MLKLKKINSKKIFKRKELLCRKKKDILVKKSIKKENKNMKFRKKSIKKMMFKINTKKIKKFKIEIKRLNKINKKQKKTKIVIIFKMKRIQIKLFRILSLINHFLMFLKYKLLITKQYWLRMEIIYYKLQI